MKDNGAILAVGAHPDDVEFTCAGTLALLHQEGYTIHICTVARGDGGSNKLGPDEIARVRAGEAASSAALLNGTYHCLGKNDLEISFDPDTRHEVAALLRKLDPFLVFTSSPEDYMPDHEITSTLVHDAAFNAACPNYDAAARERAGLTATSAVPYIYYMDSMEGVDKFGRRIKPAMWVDVGETMGTKTQMLACHDSQRQWLRDQHGMDHYIESMKSWAAQRGAEAGVISAEAFRQHLGHAFPHDNKLAEILGTRVLVKS